MGYYPTYSQIFQSSVFLIMNEKKRSGGQEPYLRSVEHLGRNSKAEKVKCDGPTDGRTYQWTDGSTKRGLELRERD